MGTSSSVELCDDFEKDCRDVITPIENDTSEMEKNRELNFMGAKNFKLSNYNGLI